MEKVNKQVYNDLEKKLTGFLNYKFLHESESLKTQTHSNVSKLMLQKCGHVALSKFQNNFKIEDDIE